MPTQLLTGLMAAKPDRTLFHYTSFSSLLGIVEDGALWASEVRYLNDAQELRHFGGLLSNFIMGAMQTQDDLERECLRQLDDWIRLRFANGPLIFTASFTEQGNLLSQWRGYCPQGRGVSLGFDPSLLAQTAAAADFALVRCIYDVVTQQNVARETVLRIVAAAKQRGPAADWAASQSHWGTFTELEGAIVQLATLMKHPSFREEDEWRFISPPLTRYVDAPIKYRAGQSSLIPYLSLPLPAIAGGLAVSEVYVGPTPTPDLAIKSVGQYLAKYAATGQQRHLMSCGIPYRP